MIDQLTILLEQQAADLEAPWFLLFVPECRSHSDELELFTLMRGQPLTYADLSPSSPVGVVIYEGAYAARGAGMESDAFSRGAASIATLVEPDQADRVAELMNRMLESVEQFGFYPALSERYVERYVATTMAILQNNEPVRARAQLAFNLGAWWLVGHLQYVHQVKVGAAGAKDRPTALAFIEGALMERAMSGLIYA